MNYFLLQQLKARSMHLQISNHYIINELTNLGTFLYGLSRYSIIKSCERETFWSSFFIFFPFSFINLKQASH